jgi:imidazolonepropionase-like amidohydrolase
MAARRAAVSERTSSPFHRESRIGSLLMAGGGAEMSAVVLLCGNVFNGLSDAGPAVILVEGNRISRIERSVERPPGAWVIDLSERTVSLGFIDTDVHLTMDAANPALQRLQSSAAKALNSLSLARDT